MIINELYLKTAFCCMACDGEIAQEEIELIKHIASSSDMFLGLDVENKLNSYISDINQLGRDFLLNYLREISESNFSQAEELQIVKIAIQVIESDNNIEYAEISFFKKIRSKLKISDDLIFTEFPNKEDFFLPDIIVPEEINWNTISFDNIMFSGKL